ncbi:hypothetical protein B0H17DRAFT_514761 [Mycena rosella]|uniref:C2H2-type domain-containing protein n=1 Tax=Mycena rosella TaxID=1033263 RepID=A0AAD7GXC2_MYCRO|nr:hypothetical protein B0H17DRAFT_514761 [Mycena rosella]
MFYRNRWATNLPRKAMTSNPRRTSVLALERMQPIALLRLGARIRRMAGSLSVPIVLEISLRSTTLRVSGSGYHTWLCRIDPSTDHINSHNSLKPYGCPKCHEHFGTSHVMKRHARKCQTHQSFRRKRTS